MTALLAGLADALAEVSSRLTYAVIAAAVVFAAGQLAGGAPTVETVNTLGWVALALIGGRLAFTTARHLLAEPGDDRTAVPA